MPKETIAETLVDNGDEKHINKLRIQWGARGDAPDAPDGWVNAGYAHIAIDTEDVGGTTGTSAYVVMNASDMDHLIRMLKRIRRKTFEAEMMSQTIVNYARRLKNIGEDHHRKLVYECGECGELISSTRLYKHAKTKHRTSVITVKS